MRNTLLLIFCFLIFTGSFAQSKIKESNGLYGIYNDKTKKWEVPASYDTLVYFPQFENPYFNSNPVCILATDKNGTTIINVKTIKKSKVYENVEIADSHSGNLIVKDKDSSYLYSIYSGISSFIGGFNSYRKFTTYDFHGKPSNIYAFKKGNKTHVYTENSYPPIKIIDGEIIDRIKDSYYILKRNGKYGVADFEGKTIIANSYDSIINTSYYFDKLVVKKENKWGIIYSDGSTILSIKYDGINLKTLNQIDKLLNDSINLYPVKLNEKWGIVDGEDKILVDYLYDSIVEYIHPLKFKVQKNSNTGLVDIKGNVLFPFNYKYFEPSNNFSKVPQNNQFYFVNNACKECNPLETEGNWGFADSTGKLLHEMNATLIPLRNYNKSQYENFDSTNYGFLWNVGGQKIREVLSIDTLMYSQIDDEGYEYDAKTVEYLYSYFFKGGETGIIGNKGEIILPINNEDLILPLYNNKGIEPFPAHDLISLNQKNRAYASMYNLTGANTLYNKRKGMWGISSLNGKVIIPFNFDSIQNYMMDRYSICEVSDSIQNTLNFPLEQYKCSKNHIIYFYTKDGKFLNKRLPQEQEIGELHFILNAPNRGDYFYTPIYNLIAINPSPEFHKLSVVTENEELNEFGDWIFVNRKHVNVIYTPTSNKFNFFNPLTSKYLFPELIEDFILLTDRSDRGLIASQWGKTNGRVKIVGQNHDNHAEVEKIDNNKVLNFIPNYNNQHFGRFDSIMFVKQNKKWFLRNLNEPNFKNKIGFDSIFVNSNSTFIAYNNGSFSTYDFNEINFNKTKIDLVFPEFGDYKLACSSCEYTYIDKKTKSPQINYDSEGNELLGDTAHSITKIPLIEKGKLNITNNLEIPILEKWVDEIIFPKCNGTNQHTNLSDKNDFLYSQPFIYDSELSNLYAAKTIAYRIDKEWYLITLDEHKIVKGPFDTIKNEVNLWITTKAGETKSYDSSLLNE